MQFIKKLFKKEPRVFYSCVVDNHPKFYWQGYIFINSLIKIANVAGERIFIHLTAKNIQFEDFLKKHNVNIKYIEPWGDKKYCNKLQQLETKELQNADYVFFCDADIAITEDLVYLVKKYKNKILGKIVDFDNPNIDVLKTIFDSFDVSHPRSSYDTLNSAETFEGNFNGGLYGIPSKYINQFSQKWKYFASQMLASREINELLSDKVNHVDQISFALALKSLDLDYNLLGYEYNFPTHIADLEMLKKKICNPVKAIHYHNNISDIGLLNTVNISEISSIVDNVNNIIKNNFNNSLFLSYRYGTNPELGSGIGSRGEVAEYKLKLLKNIGVEQADSVLDIGCGDLEIIKNLRLINYTGIDISSEAIHKARAKFPEHDFFNFDLEKEKIAKANTVLCLDVLIHQPTKGSYDELIHFISDHSIDKVIVSGYEKPQDNSHMCFFYENVKESLEKTGQFKYVFKVGEYRGLGVYIADKGSLDHKSTSNDMDNATIDEALSIKSINADLFLESVVVSRNNFQWYTKHYPRIYEYPWILEKVGRDLKNLKIADLGAGLTPLPIQLAQRGAKIFTVDKYPSEIELATVCQASEWGFFDYSIFDKNITSLNQLLDESTFETNSFDIWYSVSVVEHMPAEIRRNIFKIMAATLKNNGQLLLTVDLIKNSQQLWNMAEGKIIEDETIHGTLDDFIHELEIIGFNEIEHNIVRMRSAERVDIALISAYLKRDINK
jgi:2-polyprenyl-3-methyl-5-hydroxy-6-metoxy-1,4-benzoquinol methylase